MPTQRNTYTTFIESGALMYLHYEVVEHDSGDPDHEGWQVTFTQPEGEGCDLDVDGKPKVHTLNHQVIMGAVRRIAQKEDRPEILTRVVRECQKFLFGAPSDTDFDADWADRVMQVAVFGEIRYR